MFVDAGVFVARESAANRTIATPRRNANGPAAMNLNYYPGIELELFATATFGILRHRTCQAFIGQTVLDVGAGIGGHVPLCLSTTFETGSGIEPDDGLASRLGRRIEDGDLPLVCRVVNGTLDQLESPGRSAPCFVWTFLNMPPRIDRAGQRGKPPCSGWLAHCFWRRLHQRAKLSRTHRGGDRQGRPA